MHRALVLALAIPMLLIGRADAQGPNPEGPWQWSGFYVGLGLGGGVAVQTQTLNDIIFGSFSERSSGGGALATATVGYDWPVNQNVVAGAFFDLDISGISNENFGFLSLPVDHRYSASIGGRIGYLMTPSTLWYLSGGYSRARFDYLLLGNFDFDGIFAGAGIEKRFASNLSMRAEYRYAHYFTETLFDLCGCGSFEGQADVHTARVTLVYSFGAEAPP